MRCSRSIPITKKPGNDTEAADQPDLLGLRDRALIGIMVFSFARIGAVIQMKVGDYFVQGRRRWVRLHEKQPIPSSSRTPTASSAGARKRPASKRGSAIILSARPGSQRI